MFSSNQLKKLGKRLRDGGRETEDLLMLANYKASFDEILFDVNSILFKLFSDNRIPVILSGRSKRTKSLIRKLCRPNNRGMDLSRVDDIVGLRLIVRDIEVQNKVFDLVKKLPEFKREADYRDAEKPYRAIHVILTKGGKLIELQIRTCAQHLWAEESESFGEKTKEGGGPDDINQYLIELSSVCKLIDDKAKVATCEHRFFQSRNPLDVMYSYLLEAYDAASDASFKVAPDLSYLVTYDTKTAELISKDIFWNDERAESLKEYKRITNLLDENRFDVLLFNSKLDDALYVTHSRYFPKGIFR